MPNNYDFLDAHSSILTARSSITSGTAQEPFVIVSSVLSPVPVTFSGNPSVSGAVTIVGTPSISGTVDIGNIPQTSVHGVVSVGSTVSIGNTPSISGTVNIGTIPGSVVAFQGTVPWDISGSVLSQQLGTRVSSLVSTVPSSVIVGSSIFGQLPAGTAVLGSVATLQGTNPWRILGSVSGTVDVGVIPGSVLTYPKGTIVTSLVSTVPSSVIVGASIFGQLPAGTALLGSVATLQGTNPWIVDVRGHLPGSIVAQAAGYLPGSILTQQTGTRTTSVVGSVPSSLLTGNYGHRNDAVASYLGGDLSWRPIATDSAGRILARPFAAEEARVEGYVALTSTSLTTLIAAAGAGLKNYITDLFFANTGSVTTLITITDSAASVLGYTIAPAGSGSNLPGLLMPIRTGANASFNIQAASPTSTLYATVKGFRAP